MLWLKFRNNEIPLIEGEREVYNPDFIVVITALVEMMQI